MAKHVGSAWEQRSSRMVWEKEPQCFACETPLEPMGLDEDTTYQFDNVLWIQFNGGYGMFIDPMRTPDQICICHDCAHELCEKVPWIARFLQPESSHTHRDDTE